MNNTGTANATGVKVVDTLPPGVALVSATGTSLFVCSPAGPAPPPVTVTCTGGAVNAGQNATITINATAPAVRLAHEHRGRRPRQHHRGDRRAQQHLRGREHRRRRPAARSAARHQEDRRQPGPQRAVVDRRRARPGEPRPEGHLQDPGHQQRDRQQQPRRRRGDRPTPRRGSTHRASSRQQTIINGTVGNTGGCVVIAPQVTCSIRTLNSGGTPDDHDHAARFSSPPGPSIFDTATVTGNVKNQGVTNTASEVTTVRPQFDLTITKDDRPDPVCAHSWPVDSPVNQHLALPPSGSRRRSATSPRRPASSSRPCASAA